MSLADGQTGKKCALDHRGLERSRALPQIAIPALSPRGTEEQGMTGDANGDQEIWPNQEIYRNSQISDYLKFPPLGDWGSRGPGFKSRQPDSELAGGGLVRRRRSDPRHPLSTICQREGRGEFTQAAQRAVEARQHLGGAVRGCADLDEPGTRGLGPRGH